MSEFSFLKNKWKFSLTKGFSVWVYIRIWTFLTLAVQRFNSCKHLKGQLFIKYLSNYSKCILIKFLLQKFQGAEPHPLPPIINDPKQPAYKEFFVGILKLQTILGTEHVRVVMGRQQARKKDIRLNIFSWDWSFLVSNRFAAIRRESVHFK